jgi:uncharacterized membrane protein (DUF485 family)
MDHVKPKWVIWFSILAIAWNLMGMATFASQWMMTPADLAQQPAGQQELWGNMESWIWGAYAIAVSAGMLGALCLLFSKKLAVPLFLFSIAAILIQFSYPLVFAYDKGLMSLMLFPAFILLFGIAEYYLSRLWSAKGWLT